MLRFSLLLFRWLLFRCLLCSQLFTLNVRAEPAAEQVIPLGEFSKASLANWETVTFEGETQYRWQELDGETVLQAKSQASASGYLIKQSIDLEKFPYLNWRWRVEKALPVLAETQKAGDDYAARIYVIVSGRWFFWQTKALNYVWSSRPVKGQQWRNAYAPDNARMLAVRDSTDNINTWYQEKQNVLTDLQAWLGEDVDQIDGLAIMSDSDDSQQQAIVYYGDIYFSAE